MCNSVSFLAQDFWAAIPPALGLVICLLQVTDKIMKDRKSIESQTNFLRNTIFARRVSTLRKFMESLDPDSMSRSSTYEELVRALQGYLRYETTIENEERRWSISKDLNTWLLLPLLSFAITAIVAHAPAIRACLFILSLLLLVCQITACYIGRRSEGNLRALEKNPEFNGRSH